MTRLHEAVVNSDINKIKEYIAAGDDVNSTIMEADLYKDKYGPGRYRTPLHFAAVYGHITIAKLLLEAGAEIDKKEEWNKIPGDTAFEIAIKKQNYGMARFLKESGAVDKDDLLIKALASRNITDELLQAALYQKPEVVKDIYTSGLLSKVIGEKALIYAAKYNSLSVAETLLDCGVSPNEYVDNETALGIAAEQGNDAIAELLLKKGAEVDKYTDTKWQSDSTPLRQALIRDRQKPANPPLIEILLKYGARIAKINPRGLTCLAYSGRPEEIEILLKHGLDPDTVSENERLLDRCFKNGRYDLAITLITYGANVDYIDEKGKSYLHKSKDITLSQLLLAKGLEIELEDGNGKTPIEYADAKTAEFLAQQGASIKKLSILSHTVLSSPILMKKLIEENLADFSVLDNNGKTPLRKLAENALLPGYLDTLKLILESNLKVNINSAGFVGGWTALHDAFSKNQGHANIYNKKIDDECVAKSKYTLAIDLLIAHGAQPLKDKAGRTPLMCMTHNDFSVSFNRSIIDRYYKVEANYYGVDPERYKEMFFELYRKGFEPVQRSFGLFVETAPKKNAIETFWDNILLEKNNLSEDKKANI